MAAENIFNRGGEEQIRLNLTPMIDAVFLLLIFFMVTTVFTQSQQLKITLPEAVNYDRLKEKKLKVSISPDGELDINGELVNMADLAGVLEREKVRTTSSTLVIKADGKALHGHIMDVMKVANQLGVEKISLETDEPPKK